MELKRRHTARKLFTIFYIVSFFVYIVIGFIIPADGTAYTFDGGLVIPSIDLISGVTKLELKDRRLNTPNSIVGSYSKNATKTLLIGHSTTVFKNLDQVKNDDTVIYNNVEYRIVNMEIFKKSDIDMDKLLMPDTNESLILMTCAGAPMGEHDATHRLIITAIKN